MMGRRLMLGGWALLLASSAAAGCATCGYLAAGRRAFMWFAALGIVSLIVAAGSLLLVERDAGRMDVVIAAFFIALGAYLGGFALGATLLPGLTRPPALRRVETGPAGAAEAAFVVLADGQPEHYEPEAVTAAFDRLIETDVSVPPDALRVFAYLSERLRYGSAGPSPARPVARALIARVEADLRERGFEGPVYEAWMKGAPRLADAIVRAVSEGARTVVVGCLDVAESPLYETARAGADTVAPPPSGVRVFYAPPLWSDVRLSRLVARRVLAALPRGPRATDGVVLVSEGQPWQWDSAWPRSCEHTTFFVQRVRSELVAAGMPSANVRVAWLDWQDPGVTEVVRHLAALGCERMVVAPATMPADTIETVLDLPSAVEMAALDRDVRVEILPGWGDDPQVAAVLADAIVRTAEESGCGAGQ